MRTLFMGKYYSSFKFHHYALVESIRKETANKMQRISRKQFKIIVKMYSRWIHFPALISQHLHPYILYLKGKLCLVQYCKRISSLRRSCELPFVTYVQNKLQHSEKKSIENTIRTIKKTTFPHLKRNIPVQ